MTATFKKRATDARGVNALRSEAALLHRGAQPGVVEVVGHRFGTDAAELYLAQIEGTAFADCEFDPTQLAKTVASLAATVAHLHELGIVHRAITGQNVIISPHDSRPTLCAFGMAKRAPEGHPAMSEDIVAVASLLKAKLPDRLSMLRSRAVEDDEASTDWNQVRRLAEIADEAARPATTMSAREMASELNRLTAQPAASKPIRSQKHRISRPVKLVGAAAVVIVCSLVAALVSGPTGLGNQQVGVAEAARPTPSCPERGASALVADVDGDGCADAIVFGNGSLTVNGEVFTVGLAGDQLTIGRWLCDGSRMLAVLRPSDGRIFVFDTWPATDRETMPRYVGTVVGATHVSTSTTANACDLISVTNDAGAVTTVDPRRDPVTVNQATTTTTKKRR